MCSSDLEEMTGVQTCALPIWSSDVCSSDLGNAEHTDNPAMVEFRDRLADMLESNKTEQLKAIIIRDVIADQLTELEAS